MNCLQLISVNVETQHLLLFPQIKHWPCRTTTVGEMSAWAENPLDTSTSPHLDFLLTPTDSNPWTTTLTKPYEFQFALG